MAIMSASYLYKRTSLGLVFLGFFIVVSLFVVDVAYAQTAAANPCGSAYTVTGPDANGNYTCTQGATSITVNAAGQPVGAIGANGTQLNSNSQPTSAGAITCNGLYDFFADPITCVSRATATFIGTGIIWLASFALEWAGLLFDWIVTDTVLQFGNFVNSSVLSAINTAWSAFRDISNIVIIGMFTFIAIMTILGSVNYGAKKMISRVLIVAVLINFSLLFTKIIIDVSNFTAVQFLNAAASDTGSCTGCSQLASTATAGTTAATVTSSQANGATTGIAGAFLQDAGAQSWGNANGIVSAIAQNPNYGGWYALLYGVIIGLLEIVAAIVLLYGAFLLVSRALLMVFLMITSSIAFASYLLPSNMTGNYGWGAWWETLLKNAVFAPLLAVLLWVALTVGQAFNCNSAGQSCNQGLTSLIPSGTVNGSTQISVGINSLFGYIVVIGLLFIAIRIASSFSTSIGGFNWATAVTGAPISLGSRFTGFLGRQTIGRIGALREENLKKRRDKAKEEGDEQLASRLNLRLDRSKRFGVSSLGRRDFNAMNTSVGKAFAKNAGLSGYLAGASKVGGIKKQAETAAKEGEKVGKELVVSDAEKKKIRDSAYDEKMQNKEQAKQLLENQKRAAQQQLDIAEKTAKEQSSALENEKATHEKRVEVEEKAKTDLNNKHESMLKSISEELAKHGEGTAERAEVEKRYQTAKMTRDSEMAAQDEKIKTVRNEIAEPVADLKKKIDAITAPVEALRKDVAQKEIALKDFDKNYEREANTYANGVANEAEQRFLRAAADQAASYAQRRVSNLPYALSPGDDLFAREARGALKKGQKNKRLKERIAAEKELEKEVNGEEEKKEEGGH